MSLQPQQILDYASPGRSGRFRVGSQSVIRFGLTHGGDLEVTETLQNRGLAAVLILVDLGLISMMYVGLAPQLRRLWNRGEWDGSITFVSVIALVMLTLIVYVIKHNWARTYIHASREGVRVTFRDPFSKRGFELPKYAILTIGISQTTGTNELLIAGGDLEMRLFTAHPWGELERLREAISGAVGHEAIPVAEVVPETIPVAQVVEPPPIGRPPFYA